MEMTPDEWGRFRKALFDRLINTGGLTMPWEQFKRAWSTAMVKKPDWGDDGPPSEVRQHRAFQSFCDCGQPFSTYKMYKDEFGEDFPGCSRCGSRLEL